MVQLKYFANGHTAKGFVDHLASNIQNIENVFTLQHEKHAFLTPLFMELIHMLSKDNCELILHPEGKNHIAGVLYRERNIAFVDEAIVVQPLYQAQYIDIDTWIREEHVINQDKIRQTHQQAYTYFEKGLEIHDGLEDIYIKEMDFSKADHVADEFIKGLLSDNKKGAKTSTVYKRLFGTNTPEGSVNVVDDIISPIQNVVYVKGRAGTGKSVFMNKVRQACESHGMDLELYHCSFDPESIDMVLVRELDFCMFDSTPPHEFFPKKKQDQVIDLYELTVTPGTDEKYAEQIANLTTSYKEQMQLGVKTLQQLKSYYENKQNVLDVDEMIQKIKRFM